MRGDPSPCECLKPLHNILMNSLYLLLVRAVEDVDMRTGRAALLPFYSSREYQRLKTAYPSEAASRGVQSSNGNGKGGSSALASQVEGGALWLPHRVAVQLTTTSDKGLDIAVLWSPEPKLMLTVTRRYSVQGTLLEVLSTTGIKAG